MFILISMMTLVLFSCKESVKNQDEKLENQNEEIVSENEETESQNIEAESPNIETESPVGSLEYEIQNVQANLPSDCGNGITWTEVKINGKYLEFIYTSDEEEFSLDDPVIASNIGSLGDEMMEELKNDYTMKEVVEACKAENKGMRIMIKGLKSGKSLKMFEKTADKLL